MSWTAGRAGRKGGKGIEREGVFPGSVRDRERGFGFLSLSLSLWWLVLTRR